MDTDAISHGIQLAVAPVFLLSAVAAMITAVAVRLARIIDRARLLEDQLKVLTDAVAIAVVWKELDDLRTRGHLANYSIGLLTLCGFLIGGTIVILFLGETINVEMRRLAVLAFLSSVLCFMLALLCFLVETWIATRVLKFGKNSAGRTC